MPKLKRVLVVDDDPDIAHLLRSKLTQMGYEVQSYLHAKGAVQAAKDFNAQLVLLDVMLGDGIGYQVARELRRNPLLYRVPVLFQSVLSDKQEVEYAYSEGGDGYISKPYSLHDLSASLMRMEQLVAETDRECPDTGLRSISHLRREVDHRLYREEAFALFYLHFEIGKRDRKNKPADNPKKAIKTISSAIRHTIRNSGFYETETCHMGSGFFMVMTKFDDHDRFETCLEKDLAGLRQQPEFSGDNGESLLIVMRSTDTEEFEYSNATDMFSELKGPRAKQRRREQKKGPKTKVR